MKRKKGFALWGSVFIFVFTVISLRCVALLYSIET